MNVRYLISELQKCDPESEVELRVIDGWNRLLYIHIPHESTRYQTDDGSWSKTPTGVYETTEPNTILLTNWPMTASYT